MVIADSELERKQISGMLFYKAKESAFDAL